MTAALFVIDGQTATPTELTRGPWTPDAQHGGPPAALLTHLVETIAESSQHLARINVELLAPVPLTPLTFSVDSERLSRRVTLARAELRSGGKAVARATGRLLTTGDAPPPPGPDPTDLPQPEEAVRYTAPSWAVGRDHQTFHRDALAYRWVAGDFEESGPASCWFDLTVPVVEGTKPSGYERVVAGADIASGISAIYTPASQFGLINSDLDVTFVRPADGPWIRLEATTRSAGNGTGLCNATLWDRTGVVAFSTQTLLGRPFDFG